MSQTIAEIVEECRQRLARGESLDNCLAEYPEHAAELAHLLPIAIVAKALAEDPDPAYAEAARRRFAATLASARRARAPSPHTGILNWLQRLALPVAIVLVLVLSGFGLVQASDGTLPDSPLYPVKEAQENIVRTLARSPAARANAELRIARARHAELAVAEHLGKGSVMTRRLALDMVRATNVATQQILQTSGPQRPVLVEHARLLINQEKRALEPFTLSPNQQVARGARELLQQLDSDAEQLGQE